MGRISTNLKTLQQFGHFQKSNWTFKILILKCERNPHSTVGIIGQQNFSKSFEQDIGRSKVNNVVTSRPITCGDFVVIDDSVQLENLKIIREVQQVDVRGLTGCQYEGYSY
jgi:hypothetical protein